MRFMHMPTNLSARLSMDQKILLGQGSQMERGQSECGISLVRWFQLGGYLARRGGDSCSRSPAKHSRRISERHFHPCFEYGSTGRDNDYVQHKMSFLAFLTP